MPIDNLLKRLTLLTTPHEPAASTVEEPLPQVPPEYRHWVSLPVEPQPSMPPLTPMLQSPVRAGGAGRDADSGDDDQWQQQRQQQLQLQLQRQQTQLHHLHPAARETEFSHVRWTDINWGAAEFTRQRYTLRAYSFTRPRRTSLVVSLAILDGHTAAQVRTAVEVVARNLRFLEQRSRRRRAKWDFDFDEEEGVFGTAGGPAAPRSTWKNVVLIIVGSSDTMRPEVVEYLMRLRLFAPGMMPHRGVKGETYELAVRLRPEAAEHAGEDEERAARSRQQRRQRQQRQPLMSGADGGRVPMASSSSSASISSTRSPTTTAATAATSMTSPPRGVLSAVDDYGDAVCEASPAQPVQMLFFDSRARLRTAEEANVWTVRAFADCLKAEAWMPLDHVLGLGPFVSRQWGPLYSIGDGAVAAVLKDMGEHPECAVVFSRRLGHDARGGEGGADDSLPPGPPLPGHAAGVLGMLAACRRRDGGPAARPRSSGGPTLTATGISRPGSADGWGGGASSGGGTRAASSGMYRRKETTRELGDGVLAYRLVHD